MVTDDRLAAHVEAAYGAAPGFRALFERAGLTPADVTSIGELAKLPVTPKSALIDAQREDPPFAGFLAVGPTELRRIYVSPGPIFEPEAGGRLATGFTEAFRAAGVGPRDVVLQTFSYHLVPAGLVIDEALGELGATVVPGGTGNSELQAKLLVDLGVTGLAASTPFFTTLVERLEELGYDLPGDWSLEWAMLAGEFGDWSAKRRAIEERYGIRTICNYGVADVGLVGYEEPGEPGYTIAPDLVVQICDPETGRPVPLGEPGEVVVTSLSPVYPLIRFGTGDVAVGLEPHDGDRPAVRRISGLTGRVGDGVKIRELFVYPRHLTELAERVGAARATAEVSVDGGRDRIRLVLANDGPNGRDGLEARAAATFRELTRLTVDEIALVGAGASDPDTPAILDRRS